ncbi:MAG: hypothetical protein ABLQ96_02225 [Candidatus Acidiferrum sp.]
MIGSEFIKTAATPGSEEKAKISIDVAKKKRNTRACFEVGYVPSYFPLAGESFRSTALRTTNCITTLSL